MNTQKTNTQVNMFSENAVHDYVSGHMSKEDQTCFEKALANDESLQTAVSAERRLRAALLKYEDDQEKPIAVSDNGIDALNATLDQLGEHPSERMQTPWYNRNWYAMSGVAASIMLAVFLITGQQANDSNKNYALLSDKSTSSEIDFDSLVEAKRVAQVWPAKGTSEQELSTLFSEHGLSPIGRAGPAWIVASSITLSNIELSSLEAVEKFEQVSLISYDSKGDN